MIGALILNGDKFLGKILADLVVCCDGGYDKYDAKPDFVVGDMDSINKTIDVDFIKLNPVKDETDGEFGLKLLIQKGATEVNIYGLDGGRLDHILSNIGLMSQALKLGVKVVAYSNSFKAYMFNHDFKLSVNVGDVISLVPFSDIVHIMFTKGLFYKLTDSDIKKDSSLSISNIAICDDIEVGISFGECLVIVNLTT